MTGSDFNMWPGPDWLWWLLLACAMVGAVTILVGIVAGAVWIFNHVRFV